MKANLNRVFQFVLVLVLTFSISGFAEVEKVKIEETPNELKHPTESVYSSPAGRLGSGFGNILYGPFELPYQIQQEITRTDFFRGIIPGVLRGVSWFGAREVVGVFEIVTFFLPLRPHLDPFDASWFSV